MVHGKRKFIIETELEICAAYNEGDSSPRLADRFGCSKRTILSVLKRHSIEMRTGSAQIGTQKEANAKLSALLAKCQQQTQQQQ